MDRVAFVRSLAAAALALLLLQVVNHYGYSSVQALVILVGVAVVSVLTIGITSFAAGAVAFLVYYALARGLNDALLAAVIVAIIAAVAALLQERRGVWRW